LSFFQAGFLDNVISGYLLSGFISCVAILLITNQIPTILGVPLDLIVDEPIYMKFKHIFDNIHLLDLPSTALGIGSLLFLFSSYHLSRLLSKHGITWVHRVPIVFVLLLVTSLLSYAMDFRQYVPELIKI
jgi:MFS superfamily sulfate permease-like transporter